jgi:hypothetical protein
MVGVRFHNNKMENTDLKQIEKDICFLYHELTEYYGMTGDLDYHTFYNKKYWTYIDVDTDPFILHGCLILVLSMIWDYLDGGNYIEDKIVYYKNALKTLYGQSEDELRLIKTVNNGLDIIVAKKKQRDDQFGNDSFWAFETFVMGYFEEKADNPTECT